jgi:hypothetical protein
VALSTQQQSVIATVDIDTIFYKIPDLRQTYFKNVQGLDLLLKNWVQEQVVAPTLKEFVSKFILYYKLGSEIFEQ